MTPYANQTYANSYFADRLRTEAWDGAQSADQVKALKQATRAIDQLSYSDAKTDPAQEHQFPRGGDTLVPDPILQACCELALALLDDVDPNLEMENLGITGQGIEASRVTRDTSYNMEHIKNGIPSIQAWILLKPFMLDPMNGTLSRGDFGGGYPPSV